MFWFLDDFLVNLRWIPLFPLVWVRTGVTAMCSQLFFSLVINQVLLPMT